VSAEAVTSELTVDEAVVRLAVFERQCELCAKELDESGVVMVGHYAANHPAPRRIVHSQLGNLGADWDFDAVVAFLERAEKIIRVPEGHWLARDHAVAALGRYDATSQPKWYAFATKEAER
jgi:hypothetical protein